MSIYTEISGHGDDVVVLHGWGCDSRYMQPVVNCLKERFRITNVDLPGRGKSDWDSNIHSIHDIADCLKSILPKKAIYIGWSFGGLVTMSIASRFEGRVKQFIGIGTTPRFVEDTGWPGIPKPGLIAGFEEIKNLGYKKFIQNYFDAEFIDFNPKPKEYFDVLHLLENDPQCNINIVLKGINICDATDLRKEFQTLNCPIDLIMGELDSSLPVALHDHIKELNPRSKIHVISKAHHMMFWTHQKEFDTILKKII